LAGRFWWTQPVKGHAMMCFPPRIMALEEQLTERLARTTRFERVGSTLILRTDDGRSLTLTPATAPVGPQR
jgi:heat shock protein HslJ